MAATHNQAFNYPKQNDLADHWSLYLKLHSGWHWCLFLTKLCSIEAGKFLIQMQSCRNESWKITT